MKGFLLGCMGVEGAVGAGVGVGVETGSDDDVSSNR
jgi:hypothetical protein